MQEELLKEKITIYEKELKDIILKREQLLQMLEQCNYRLSEIQGALKILNELYSFQKDKDNNKYIEEK
ncbi:MAG: hypothetical protein N2114_06035 [Candidatus Goldbacteria bacterium]|nr:hypothetical protein [Candidatus Goldiibacteriota bacterium]